MKKIVFSLLLATLVITLSGCGNKVTDKFLSKDGGVWLYHYGNEDNIIKFSENGTNEVIDNKDLSVLSNENYRISENSQGGFYSISFTSSNTPDIKEIRITKNDLRNDKYDKKLEGKYYKATFIDHNNEVFYGNFYRVDKKVYEKELKAIKKQNKDKNDKQKKQLKENQKLFTELCQEAIKNTSFNGFNGSGYIKGISIKETNKDDMLNSSYGKWFGDESLENKITGNNTKSLIENMTDIYDSKDKFEKLNINKINNEDLDIQVSIKDGINGKLSNNQKIKLIITAINSNNSSISYKYSTEVIVDQLATYAQSLNKEILNKMTEKIKEINNCDTAEITMYNKETGSGIIVLRNSFDSLIFTHFMAYELGDKFVYEYIGTIETFGDDSKEGKIIEDNLSSKSSKDEVQKVFEQSGYTIQ